MNMNIIESRHHSQVCGKAEYTGTNSISRQLSCNKCDNYESSLKQSLDEMSRLELENDDYKKELKLCKDYIRKLDSHHRRIADQTAISGRIFRPQHEASFNSSFESDEMVCYEDFRRQYKLKMCETMLESQVWGTSHPLGAARSQEFMEPHSEFLAILDQNDKISRDVEKLEDENNTLIEESTKNQEKIQELMEKATDAFKRIQIAQNQQKPVKTFAKKPPILDFDKIFKTETYNETDEGFTTKRSSVVTEKLLSSAKPTPELKRRYSSIEEDDYSAHDISFERWARELHVHDPRFQRAYDYDNDYSNGYQYSVENLISELKHEYKLNDSDVTKMKLELDTPSSLASRSRLDQSIHYGVDKDVLKSSLLLGLMNKKVEKLTQNESHRSAKRDTAKAESYRKKRMAFSIHSNLFGKLLK